MTMTTTILLHSATRRILLLLMAFLPLLMVTTEARTSSTTRKLRHRRRATLAGGYRKVSLHDADNADRRAEFQHAANFVLQSLIRGGKNDNDNTDDTVANPPPAYDFWTNNNDLLSDNKDHISIQPVRVYEQVVAGLNLNMVVAVYDSVVANSNPNQNVNGNENSAAPTSQLSPQNCLGAFAVSVYDRFGQSYEITHWAKETTCETALAIWQQGGEDDA
eukprot:CAMPEP_0168854356 /NCGR_PEP_ID=MMETSP0727-20121128/14035_1 /TAXON_ID=265536 /ORGANISM="Amphiprora sp., Strain CCMP467" /LENGTH=218 /DNA_ID=CAMNT_0008908677 /DNA_START=8 /DNA_END=664 /DNA_ORIENTATION=-